MRSRARLKPHEQEIQRRLRSAEQLRQPLTVILERAQYFARQLPASCRPSLTAIEQAAWHAEEVIKRLIRDD